MVKKKGNAKNEFVHVAVSTKKENTAAIIIFTVILSFLIGVVGWYLGAYVVKDFSFNPLLKVNIEEPKPLESELPKNRYNSKFLSGNIVRLTPILTNLKSNLPTYKNDEVWLRAEIDLLLQNDKIIDEATKEIISDNFLSYFRQTDLLDLRGPTSLIHIKEDLLDRANILTNNAIKHVFIRTLVTQ